MKDIIITILGMLFGGGLFAFIQFLITRKDNKHSELQQINSKLDVIENEIWEGKRYSCRSELLILMNHYPNQTEKIFRLAEHYFLTLKGDFYMTSMFVDFCKDNNLEVPKWFKGDE